MSDPVPAITEADASGATAEIFADIRAVLGVNVVNLIWRHLATIPGALPWAWGTLRPVYVDGAIAMAAAKLHDELDLPRLPIFPPQVLAAAGLSSEDITAIGNILAAYDRTNSMALIALSALRCRLHDNSPASGAVPGKGMPHEPRSVIPLPPLPDLADLPPSTAQLVLALNRLGTQSETPILASMYRHLAYWPSYLALGWVAVSQADADGRLGRAIADAIAKAEIRAEPIAAQLRSAPEPAIASRIDEAVAAFTGDVIAKMVVICAILRRVSFT